MATRTTQTTVDPATDKSAPKVTVESLMAGNQMKPYAQQWAPFQPGFQSAIASQLSQGFGAPASDYMAQMNQTYAPMNFMQYRYPLDALLGQGYKPPAAGGGTTPLSGLTWDIYNAQYRNGDGSVYPAGMGQNKFNTWLAAQNAGTSAPAPAPTTPTAPTGIIGSFDRPAPRQGWIGLF